MAPLLDKITFFGIKSPEKYLNTKDKIPAIVPLPPFENPKNGIASPKVYSLTIYFNSSASPSPGGWDDPTLACAGTGTPLTVYALSGVPLLSLRQAFNDGLQLCLDSALTSPLVGGDKWFKDAQYIGGDYMSVGNDGFIALMGVCPSPSPSPSCTPTVTPSRTCTPTVTPSISITPSTTPSISLTPSISRTPSVTPTRTPSVTPSPVPCSLTLYFDVTASPSPGGWNDPNLACAGTGTPLTVYFSGPTCPSSFEEAFTNGKAIYIDSALTTVLQGGDKWFKDAQYGGGNYMNVGNDGFIAQLSPCLPPSPTPTVTPSRTCTPTVTPSISITPSTTPSISITPSVTPTLTPSVTPSPVPCSLTLYFDVAASPSPGGWDTSTLACEGTGTPLTVYFSGPVCPTSFYEAFTNGKALYLNSTLTTVLQGGDKWFKDAQLGTGNYMNIGNDGFIAQLSPCPGATPLPTPTPTKTPTPTISVSTTPSISVTPTISVSSTPSVTVTLSSTPAVSPTTTPSISPTPSIGSLDPFITVWETTNSGSSSSNQITLPLQAEGTYNFNVNWGDGNTDTITTWNQAQTTHTYSSPGEYTVTITGTCSGFAFENTGDKQKILRVVRWGNVNLGDYPIGIFAGCSNLDLSSVIGIPNLSAMTTLKNMFNGCTSLTTINNVGSWNVSTITDMQGMFFTCENFNQSLNTWDVSNVTNMSFMFFWAFDFNGNITSWDVSSVTTMESMFVNCGVFNQAIGSWNVSSVTNMANMFSNCSIFNQNISSWNVVNVTDMSLMFNSATVFNQNISSWNVANVTDMAAMFQSAVAFNQPIGTWNVSSVTNMSSMFNNATNFNQALSGWNVSSVTNMTLMFRNATAFNQNIGGWNISNVTSLVNFMSGKTDANYSTTNLNAIYNGWSLLTVQPNLTVNFGTIKYTSAGQAGRNTLTSAPKSWTITDGGV